MFELHFYKYNAANGHFHLSDEVARDVSAFAGKPCRIYADAHGKPLCDGAFLSVAHTEDVAVLAVSDAPIGVDIENKKRALGKALSACSIEDWVAAEAAFKLTGVPVRRLLCNIPDTVAVSHFERGEHIIAIAEKTAL